MEKLSKLLNNAAVIAWGFLTSKDMKAIYWTSFAQFVALSGDLLVQQLTAWNPDNLITVFVGLIIARITKKLNSKK